MKTQPHDVLKCVEQKQILFLVFRSMMYTLFGVRNNSGNYSQFAEMPVKRLTEAGYLEMGPNGWPVITRKIFEEADELCKDPAVYLNNGGLNPFRVTLAKGKQGEKMKAGGLVFSTHQIYHGDTDDSTHPVIRELLFSEQAVITVFIHDKSGSRLVNGSLDEVKTRVAEELLLGNLTGDPPVLSRLEISGPAVLPTAIRSGILEEYTLRGCCTQDGITRTMMDLYRKSVTGTTDSEHLCLLVPKAEINSESESIYSQLENPLNSARYTRHRLHEELRAAEEHLEKITMMVNERRKSLEHLQRTQGGLVLAMDMITGWPEAMLVRNIREMIRSQIQSIGTTVQGE